MSNSRLTTLEEPTRTPADAPAARGLRIVIVWHRDLDRIGAVAWVPWGPGASLDISRHLPLFSDGAPLADPRISRMPLQLLAAAGGIQCWPAREGLRFEIDGVTGSTVAVTAEQVRRGFRLGLGRAALLHVRAGPTPRPAVIPSLVGGSEDLEAVAATVVRAARGDGSVLVLGETGTGKELVAHAVHALGGRHPLVVVNMAALTPALAPSQLFGHARGAFTGAESASTGYFREADGGVLFLDEIGACPMDVQGQLLRAIETGEVQGIGTATRRVDVRVVAATDTDLEKACEEGRFRAPLYHRLARWVVRIPPLRTRSVDVAVQAAFFLREGLRRRRRSLERDPDATPWFGREVMEALLDAPWPGNTRELRACVERLLDEGLDRETCELPRLARAETGPTRSAVAEALASSGYNLTAAAERLGVGRNTLKRWMVRENLRRPVDLGIDEIAAALAAARGVRAAALALGVSEHGLRLRMAELGL